MPGVVLQNSHIGKLPLLDLCAHTHIYDPFNLVQKVSLAVSNA